MADVVHVKAPDLTQAASTVAAHLETVAKPATAALPPQTSASPVDVAASGAAGAMRIKMTALSAEMAPKGPAIQQVGAAAAAALLAQDAANSARLPSVPSVPNPPAPSGSSRSTPRAQAMSGGWKQDPAPKPPGPPGNPLAGWTDEQKLQVAREIAHGHASPDHAGDFPGMDENGIARWIYDTMNDPSSLAGTSNKSGGLALFRDGRIVFIDPNNTDYGTIFKPTRDPMGYFLDKTSPTPPELSPPLPGDVAPLPPGESPPRSAAPPAAPRPSPPAPEPAPKPGPKPGPGRLPFAGGPGANLGPQIVPPLHAHPHWLGETPEEEWEDGQH